MPVLQFLKNIPHDVLNAGEGVVREGLNIGSKFGNELGALGAEATGNNPAAQRILQPGGGLGHQGGILGGAELGNDAVFANPQNIQKTVGFGAEAASFGIAPEAKSLSFLKGAAAGATAGALGTAGVQAQAGQFNPGQIAGGAAIGGALGTAATGATKIISDIKASRLAKMQNQQKIVKELTPDTGPAVAQDVAGAIAHTDDPKIVQGVIQQDITKRVPPEAVSPAPPTADAGIQSPSVSQPTEAVGQGTLGAQPLNPQSGESVLGNTAVKPFLNAPPQKGAESITQPTHISALSARESATNVLNEGGTIDEAMNELHKAGMNLGEAKTTIADMMKNTGQTLDKSKVNASLNPQYGKISFPEAQVGDAERAPLNAQTANNEVWRRANVALAEGDKLSPKDIKLLDYLSNSDPKELAKQAKNPEQFSKTANLIKDYNDYNQAAGAHLGQDIPYRQNYGIRRQYDTSPEGQAAMQQARAKLSQSPGYTKGQFFKNYDEAAQFGLQRQNENALQDLAQDASQRASHQSQLSLQKALEEAYPGQVKSINSGNIPNGYTQLQIPGGNKLFLPDALAKEINKRVQADPSTGFFKGYDSLNSNLKNLKLAGGGFHSINVLGSYGGQQIVSMLRGDISPTRAFSDLGTITKGTFSDTAYKTEMDRLNQSGKLLDADASGLIYSMGGVQADVGKSTGIVGKIPLLNKIHEAIFERQIPLLKLKIFEQKTEELSRNNPEDLKQMTSIAKELNQNFGGVNQAIQGLTPKQFKIASRIFLATDYNEGQLLSLRDAFTKGGAEGKLAREVVFGKAMLFGGLATAGAVAGGDFDSKKPSEVAFDILHKIANPKFSAGGYNVSLPTTQVAEVAKPLEETIKGVQTGHNLQGVQNFANARLAAIPAATEQLAGNQNYAGQKIYGTDSHGRPISPTTTALNIAGTATPIPATQTIQTATGNESPLAAIANTIGVRATPQYDASRLPVGLQTHLQREKASGYPDAKISADTSFFSILQQNAKARQAASNQITKDIAKGDMTQANKDAIAYNQKLIQQLKPWAKDNKQYVDQTLISQLTGSQFAPATGLGLLKVSGIQGRQKSIKNNPLKYGQSITPLP